MGALAISLLWMLIYAIILAGVVWLVLYGIKTFIMDIPPLVEKGIWLIVLLLVIIFFLYALTGAGPSPFRLVR